MTYCWKEEFALVDDDGDEFAWFDDEDEAIEEAFFQGATKVTRIRHYADEREDIWGNS